MYSLLKRAFPFFLIFLTNIFSSAFAWGDLESTSQSVEIDKIIQQQGMIIESLVQDIKILQVSLKSKPEDEHVLTKWRLQARDISKKALEGASILRISLNDINEIINQLTILGDNTKNLENEKKEYSNITEQKNKINSALNKLEEIFLAANKIAELTISQSRELFARMLTQRFEFSISMVQDVIEKTKEVFGDFLLLFDSWWKFVLYFKPLQLFFAFFIPFIVTLGLSYFSSKSIAYVKFYFLKKNDEISYLQRLLIALISILLPSFICAIYVYLTLFLFRSLGLYLGILTEVFYTIGHQIILVFLLNRITVILLSPYRAHIRLLNVAPLAAYQLIVCLTLLGMVFALDTIIDSIYRIISVSFSLIIEKSFISVFLMAVLLFIISFVPLQFRRQSTREEAPSWLFCIRIPIIMLGLLLIIIAFLGYIGLARFIMQQVVICSVFLALMYLGVRSACAIGIEGEFIRTSVGRSLVRRFHLEEKTMNRLGIISSIFLNLIVIVFCTVPIVMQFGFSYSDIGTILLQLMTSIQIGSISISLISVVMGIIVFFICLFFSRLFVRWLDITVLVRGEFDSGVRNSIKTVITYGGVAISTLIGLSIAGLNVRNFALIAGGLSLGIGFGLQNIVQNFVSGLIILIGRPFKLGDYIETGSVRGIVKRISVRATEIETFQRQTIIVPNSSLINNNVSNWTRPSKIGRIDIPLTVSTTLDPERVVEMLLEVASVIEGVLKNPAPQVSFTAFDSKNFSFTLAVYVPNITSTSKVTNALHFILYKRFVEEGILQC
ncbi:MULTISPECIES: mechanosensitive ion channel family protein [unclassified Bartonella]|uniref:mechanosensitive ion channel family protein n=1 Tax=unclassified Bartonella TaxID=2645622 RepID=UPI00099A078F|nr:MULTISPECIES: mechanosensitive ion channel domain-containing protein [unclassified Bartonella]AQX27837.1 Small-conductance mechanosensitive channel [Bartonella sp. JB15]AQX29117.1 Small-conductance mechanosensitive channel [Bartonella sp. JB63]